MARLEFTTLENEQEAQEVIKALLNGNEYKKPYTSSEGKQEFKIICKNRKMYIGSNYAISLSKSNDGKLYLGIDYHSSDDRIQVKKYFDEKKKEQNK